MDDLGTVDSVARDELMKRLELMESMIGEGQRLTARYGWAFLLWGVADGAVMLWRYLMPHSQWVGMWSWPVGLVSAALLTVAGVAMKCKSWGRTRNPQAIKSVWSVLLLALTLYIGGAMTWGFSLQVSYMAGVLMLVGMAHGISALMLRWWGQGLFAVLWGAGGVSLFVDPTNQYMEFIMLLELSVGMIVFGLYTMWLERRLRG